MNILIISDYFPPDKLGGIGEIAKNLQRHYDLLGHDAYVLTTGRRPAADAEVRVYRSGKSLILGVLRNNVTALRLIRRLSIDVVHLHQASTTFFLLLRLFRWPSLRRVQVVSSFQVSYWNEMREVRTIRRGGFTFRPTGGERFEKYVLGPVHVVLDTIGYLLADVVTAVSSETRSEVLASYGRVRKKQVRVVPNGCAPLFGDSSASAPADAAFETFAAGKRLVAYVGVFRVRKRLFNLLLAVRDLARQQRDVGLVIVGGGRRYSKRLDSFISQLALEDSVFRTGQVPNDSVPYYLQAADVVCLPSSYEGMPVVLLEAMSMARTVVTSDVSGMRDLIDHGRTGMLVPVDDVEALAAALAAVLGDSELQAAMGEAARVEVSANYPWSEVAERYLELVAP